MVKKELGIFGSELFDRSVIYINGRSPSYTARWIYAQHDDIINIVLSNNYTANVVGDITKHILSQIFDNPWEPTQIPKINKTVDEEVIKNYTGSYRFDENAFSHGLDRESNKKLYS